MSCLQARHTLLTRTKAFKRLTRWAFAICDADKTGKLDKAELYAGILLVHLQLAKYTGPASCYPPTRQVVEQLFEASDDDKSGYIDEEEFEQIMVISCAQITSRIMVYYAVIIFLVPRLAAAFISGMLTLDDVMGWSVGKSGTTDSSSSWIDTLLTFGNIAEQTVYYALFFLVIPICFNRIDQSSREAAASYLTTPSVSAKGVETSGQEKKEE